MLFGCKPVKQVRRKWLTDYERNFSHTSVASYRQNRAYLGDERKRPQWVEAWW